MQGLTGVEIQSKLIQKYPHIPVAFITGFGEISTVIKVFQQGAVDFIQKPFDEKIICTLVNKMLLQAKSNLQELLQLNGIVEKFNKLTSREVQVFNCILDEMLNREIAQLLDISIKTVEARRASVMEKFGVRRPAGLFHAAHLLSEAKKQGF
jgi:FixJ family two-component response regulator